MPELELGGETGNGTEGAERTVEVVESTAMRGKIYLNKQSQWVKEKTKKDTVGDIEA